MKPVLGPEQCQGLGDGAGGRGAGGHQKGPDRGGRITVIMRIVVAAVGKGLRAETQGQDTWVLALDTCWLQEHVTSP